MIAADSVLSLQSDPTLPDEYRRERVNSPEELSAARDATGISAQQIADRLRIDVSQVNAIEAGNWERLPSRAFARGAVRSVARLIDVDAGPVVDLVGGFGEAEALRQGMRPQAAIPVATASMMGRSAHRHRAGFAARSWATPRVAGGVAVIGLIVLWFSQPELSGTADNSRIVQIPLPDGSNPIALSGGSTVVPVNARQAIRQPGGSAGVAPTDSAKGGALVAAATALIPAVAVGETAAVSASKRQVALSSEVTQQPQMTFPVQLPATESVKLDFSRESWVEIRHKEGEKLLFGTQKRNKSVILNGVPPMQVVIGNPDGVKMWFRGELVNLKASTRKGVSRLVLN